MARTKTLPVTERKPDDWHRCKACLRIVAGCSRFPGQEWYCANCAEKAGQLSFLPPELPKLDNRRWRYNDKRRNRKR